MDGPIADSTDRAPGHFALADCFQRTLIWRDQGRLRGKIGLGYSNKDALRAGESGVLVRGATLIEIV